MILGVMKAKTNFPYDPQEAPIQPILPIPLAAGLRSPKAIATMNAISSIAPPPPPVVVLSTLLNQYDPNNNDAESNDDSNPSLKNGDRGSKRSYVGIKLRKQTGKEEMITNQKKTAVATNAHSQLTFVHQPSFNSSHYDNGDGNNTLTLAPSLVHLPLQLAQNHYVMNNIPPSFTPVLHPSRYIDNDAFRSLNNVGNHSNSSTSHRNKSTRDHGSRQDSGSHLNNNANSSSEKIDWSKHAYIPLEITSQYDHQSRSYSPLPLPATHHLNQEIAHEPDWRDQIYYWQGKLSYDDNLQSVTWKGHWMGSFTGKPGQEEFAISNNDFVYHSISIEKSKVVSIMNQNSYMNGNGSNGSSTAGYSLLRPVSGYYKGYYMMQNNDIDDKHDKYTDKEFLVEFEENPSKSFPFLYNVYGKGDSEFGIFILHGTYDSNNKILEMSRQYIADCDLRCSMSLPQLKQYFKRISW
jgi:hypothetical protein